MLIVACSSEEQSAPTANGTAAATSMPTNKATSTPTIAPIRKPTQAPSTPKLEVKAPLQGESVTSPVTVEVASTHLIAAPELNVPNAAHYHVFVDKVPFTAGGMTIPMDAAGVYHFAQNTLELDIPPGKHTIV